jgi:hypothetical protein
MSRRLTQTSAAAFLAVLLGWTSGITTAVADEEANVQASCEGIVSSRIDPGDREYLARLTKSTTAPTLGFESPGGYTSYFANFRGSEIGPECS